MITMQLSSALHWVGLGKNRGQAEGDAVPLNLRLGAWWEGYSVEDYIAMRATNALKKTEEEADDAASAKPEPKPESKALWSPARIKINELVWGEGFTQPGGADFVIKYAKPFAINPKMHVLDLGCTLGGSARAITRTWGCYVTAMDRDKDLVKVGNELSTKAGLAKKAALSVFEPDKTEFKVNQFDCVFATDFFSGINAKEALLKNLSKSLKERGQVTFIEYTLVSETAKGQEVRDWISAEPVPPLPWTAEQYRSMLIKFGYDVRVCEDITNEYKILVLQGWDGCRSRLRGRAMHGEEGSRLLREMDLWQRRVKAMDSGELRVFRFFALKVGGGSGLGMSS